MRKTIVRLFQIGLWVLMIQGFFSAPSNAEDFLLDTTSFPRQYLIEMNGIVMNENFSGAQGLLNISKPTPFSQNPYLITIQGFPLTNNRNSFYWNSDYSEMTVISNHVACSIRRNIAKATDIHFYFLSPVLLQDRNFWTQHEDERVRLAEKMALPTRVNAQAGGMDLRIHSNFVSGTVWMKGYDPVEKAYVHYSADIIGKRSYSLESGHPYRK